MCSVVGIVAQQPANQALYEALTVIQHRGQDAAGILTSDGGKIYERKDSGLVRDVFHTRHMLKLKGTVGIGHTRYPTAGSDSKEEAQPFYVNSPFGLALAHNGNLTNAGDLADDVFRLDLRQLNTHSDSEILLNILAHELHAAIGNERMRLTPEDVFNAITRVHKRCVGAYAVVGLIVGFGLFAFRDPNGIRPLVWGCRNVDGVDEHMVASESVALDVLGFDLVRDVAPGEALYIDLAGTAHTFQCIPTAQNVPCIFEYVYLARPDSIIDEISVYKTRLRLGERLGQRICQAWPDHDIDVVIPVPDTSRTAAMEVANVLDVIYREGFIKNRYIGRTFIMPGQAERRRSVRQKLNAIDLEFRNKNVLIVDDSIVRGTTSKQIVQMAREAGAAQVYFASAAPPVRHPNVYGIDMPAVNELVAHGRSEAQIGLEIGADRLFYQTIDDLVWAASQGNPNITEFEASCFNGHYVTEGVSEDYLKALASARNDAEKLRRRQLDLELLAS